MKFHMTLIAAVLGVGLIVAIASLQQEINYKKMVDDLRVMCRIIDKTMEETFEKDYVYVKSGLFGRRGCQPLYLKGYGVVFLLELQFPVAEVETKVVKTEKEMDLWERYEREIRHQPQLEAPRWVVGTGESHRADSYDTDKVDRLKERLASLVGEYGTRIGQLESDDMISVVVFGRPEHGEERVAEEYRGENRRFKNETEDKGSYIFPCRSMASPWRSWTARNNTHPNIQPRHA